MTWIELSAAMCLFGGAPFGLVACLDTEVAWWGWVVCAFAGQVVGVAGSFAIMCTYRWEDAVERRFGGWLASVLHFGVPMLLIPGTVVSAFAVANVLAGLCRR